MTHLSVKISQELKDKLEQEAEANEKSISQIVRKKLRNDTGKKEDKISKIEEKLKNIEKELNNPNDKDQNNTEEKIKTDSNLTEVDKKIIYHSCSRYCSYEELSDLIGVSKNTVYRRLRRLRKENYLRDGVKYFPNLQKLGLSFVMMGITVNGSKKDEERISEFLRNQKEVKFVWMSFGGHDLVAHLVCKEDESIEKAKELKSKLKEFDITIDKVDTSISNKYKEFNIKDLLPTLS